MNKKILSVALGTAVLAAAGTVTAGAPSLYPLSINYAARYANGGLAETHNTPDFVQYAECGSNSNTGYCAMRDASGTYTSCYTTDPALIEVIRSMSDESFFSISWSAAGVCTYVLSYASSRTEAKN